MFLYAATNGYVLALNPLDGAEVWRRKLPDVSGSAVICLLVFGDDLYAGGFGRLFCLNKHTGNILWRNDLRGMGYKSVTLAIEGLAPALPPLVAAVEAQRAAEASSA
jgi:outer membrane protein assembly factor BamB